MPWTTEQKEEALRKHEAWLRKEEEGKQLAVHDDELRGANLRWADLRWADLRWADLRWADLREADLRGANLIEANLMEANLREADLTDADLRKADLIGANLTGCQLDFSCWPLWCGSSAVVVDARLFRQIVDHLLVLDCSDDEAVAAQKWLRKNVSRSHREKDLGLD